MILVRYRRVLLPLLGAVVGWVTLIQPPDLYRFGQLGDLILRGQLGAVYGDAWNQAGPLQLLLARLLLLGGTDGTPAGLTAAAVDAALVWLAMALCTHRGMELLAGSAVLLWLGLQQPWNGHPIELLIPAGWVFALQLQRSDHQARAILVLAATLAVAPWAILGFPALVAVAPFRRASRTAALGTAAGVLCYLPFVLSGHFALFSHSWPVDSDSAVHLLAPMLHTAGWPVRLVQALVCGGGCLWVAHRTRQTPLDLVAAPLAVALLRVATDPVSLNYYWLSAALLGVLVLAQAARPDSVARWVSLSLVVYLPWMLAATGSSLLGREFVGALACLAALLALTRPDPYHPEPVRDDAGHGVPAYAR